MNSPSKSRWKPVWWLLAGIALVVAAFFFDDRADAALDATRNPVLKNVAWWLSKSAEGEIVGGMGILLAAIFFLLNLPKISARIFFAAATALLTGLAGTILRVFVGRTRPESHGPAGVAPGFYGVWHDGHWILGKAAFSSFPSGHAAVAVGLAAAIFLMNRKIGLPVALWALAVMWSRVALGWHHVSDVLASAVLAMPLALLLKKFLAPTVEFQFDNFFRAWKK